MRCLRWSYKPSSEVNGRRVARDSAHFGGMARSITALMNSHNVKEETVLYPLCDHALRQFTSDELSQMVPRP